LKDGPGLEAKTLLEEMQRRYPGRFGSPTANCGHCNGE
jgi:hypothetical protein